MRPDATLHPMVPRNGTALRSATPVNGPHEIRDLPAATPQNIDDKAAIPPSARRPEPTFRANWTPGKPTETITLRDGLGSGERLIRARR